MTRLRSGRYDSQEKWPRFGMTKALHGRKPVYRTAAFFPHKVITGEQFWKLDDDWQGKENGDSSDGSERILPKKVK